VAVNVGWAIGPAASGFLLAGVYPHMFAATALMVALCGAVIAVGLERDEPLRSGQGFKFREALSVSADVRFFRFSLLACLIATVMAQLVVSLSVHSVTFLGLSEREVGLLFTLNGVIVIFLQNAVARSLRRHPITLALAGGSLLYAAGYLSVGLARSFAALAAAITVVSLGEIVVSPGIHALAANLAPKKLEGRYLGFHGLMFQAGHSMGPMVGGLGLRYLSPRWLGGPWMVVSGLAAAASLGFFRFGRHVGNNEQGLEPL
jgi:predicted MFS family arabinose efflux permease